MAVFKRYKGKRITARDKNWRRGRWYIYKRIAGRVIHKSIPEAQTKEEAELAERKIIEQAFNNKYGVISTTTFRNFANNQYTRYYEQHNINIGAKRLYVRYLVERFGNRALSDITAQDCRDVQAVLKKKTSASSCNRIMSTASRIFTLACEEGILDRNPMQYVKSLKEPPPRQRILTKEERERLWLELEKDELLFRLVILAVNLPIRKGQLLAITPAAVNAQNGVLWTIGSKGRAPRAIPLNTTAIRTLQQMIESEQLPFPLKDFRRRWTRTLIAAGINKPGGTREENFHFHDLRTEFGTRLVRENVNPEIIRQLYAHSDLAISQIYIAEELEQQKAAVNKLDASELQPTDETKGLPN